MADPELTRIFRAGSRTYFFSSIFFAPAVRDDVFRLYGFVRTADDFVDQPKGRQRPEEFAAFRRRWEQAANGTPCGDLIVDGFADLARRKRFDRNWIEAFLDVMGWDLTRDRYETVEESISYMYGSAEVIGLMMAAIMSLPAEAYPYAQLLGRSMQYINFIRDIAEDNELGRIYLPVDELGAEGLTDLQEPTTSANPEAFRRFLRRQVERYEAWRTEATNGFAFIPRRSLIPIRTASDMYHWTASRIARDPFIVYRNKVKPRAGRVMSRIVRNTLFSAPPAAIEFPREDAS